MNNGGPAFPVGLMSGLTVRDYFAAAALQGMLACMSKNIEAVAMWEKGAATAYKLADAMLAERERKGHE